MRAVIVPVLAVLALALADPCDQATAAGPEFSPQGRLDCPDAVLYWYPDGTYEDVAYWQYPAVMVPDYGALAEGFPGISGYVCGIRLELRRAYNMSGNGFIDPYVWEFDPGTENPGAVLSVIPILPVNDVPAYPATLTLDVQMPESYAGSNGFFVGYWPRSALNGSDFSLGVDYDLTGCPRTKWAPGLGYPTGWGTWDIGGYTMYKSLALDAFVTANPTPVRETSWGAVKKLYR
jgi:hypothetical protein